MEALLRLAVASDATSVADVLIESRNQYLPFAPFAYPEATVRDWVAKQLLPSNGVTVAEVDGKVVAVLAVSEAAECTWIDQLYVLPGYTGNGFGTRLLRHAHQQLRPPIRLYTFQENSNARRFYERHGYRVLELSDGSGNQERCPDVLYERAAPTAEA